MSKCRNFFLCCKSLTTNGTLLTIRKTAFGTSRSLACYSFLGMTKSCSFVCYIAVTTYGTSVSSITTTYASGIGYYSIVVMSKCGNFSLSYKSFTAYCTLLTIRKTAFGTSGCCTGNNCFSMTKKVNNNLSQCYSTTYRALLTIGKSTFGASRCLAYDSLFNMTESINYFLRYNNLITNSAMLSFGKTGSSTGRSYCGVNHDIMAAFSLRIYDIKSICRICNYSAIGIRNRCPINIGKRTHLSTDSKGHIDVSAEHIGCCRYYISCIKNASAVNGKIKIAVHCSCSRRCKTYYCTI